MCNAKSEGGRRCPCDDPEARAARRRASRAVVQAPEGGIRLGGTTTDAVASPADGWDREAVTRLAEDVSLLAGKDLDNLGGADERTLVARDRVLAEHGTVEAAVSAVGAQIAQEAERRSGVNVAALSERERERRDAVRERMNTLRARAEELKADLAEHPAMERAHAARDRQRDEVLTDAQYEAMDKVIEDAEAEVARTPEGQELLANKAEQAELGPVLYSDAADPQTRTELTALSSAYVEVLSETRQMGGTLALIGSDEDAGRLMGGVAAVYPTDWVESSNASSRGLQVVTDSSLGGGAHYRDRVLVEQVREVDAYDAWDKEEVESPDYSYGAITDPDDPDEQMRVRFRYDVKVKGEGAESPGPGWERYDGPGQTPGMTTWRRPQRMEEDRLVSFAGAVITLGDFRKGTGTQAAADDPRYTLAVHEVGHHFEARVPGIVAMEREFLVRRTTDEDGNRMPQTSLWNASDPADDVKVRADSFADAYMSREYADACEVMTTGAEALFGGSYGGLVGRGKYAPDPDMRAFVLGVMASAGRRQEGK